MLGDLITTIFGSILSGGATGLIGVVLQRFADYKNKQLDITISAQNNSFELAKKDKDIELMEKEWTGRDKVASTEGEAKMDAAASEAFSKSFESESTQFTKGATLTAGQTWLMVVLDFMRGSIRPVLTIYLCVLTTYIYYQAQQALESTILTPDQALSIVKMTIGTILYLFTTCTLWWFGTRNKQKPIEIK